ncbi:MAG TPA: pyridoxamine 5'-phosphate oxidase family protein [Micromonosporaceae bacterium]|nr:pyridoxamine 5'-phosphate oxidase family protein [Micromonosporaceae bacterium]
MTLTLTNGFVPWSVVDLQMRAARTIWLATVRPDDRAHAVPVWFVWRAPAVYTMSRRDLQKAVNLRHQSWAVAHLGDGDDTIILEGPATVVSDAAEVDAVDRAWSAKYVDPGTGTHDTVRVPDADVWRIDPAHVMTWAYGDVTSRTDWRLTETSA